MIRFFCMKYKKMHKVIIVLNVLKGVSVSSYSSFGRTS